MLEPGTEIDGCTIQAFVQAGGLAEVYRAIDNASGKTVAIKRLVVNDAEQRARMLREGRVLLRLRHPNVLRVLRVSDAGTIPVLVMEFIDGVELAEWMYGTQPPLDEVERIFRRILAGVGYAHRLGVVHRDLHPWNILVAQEPGQKAVPKVIDFGLVKLPAGAMTRTGVMMGTPAYMAPEQIIDAKMADRRADIFSLGCILYYMVCGREAFSQKTDLELLQATASAEYPHPHTFCPGLSGRFVRAIEGSIRAEPGDRFPDVETMLRVLKGDRR